MRSFRNKVVSAVAWAVPVFAAALPGHAALAVAQPATDHPNSNSHLLHLGMLLASTFSPLHPPTTLH